MANLDRNTIFEVTMFRNPKVGPMSICPLAFSEPLLVEDCRGLHILGGKKQKRNTMGGKNQGYLSTHVFPFVLEANPVFFLCFPSFIISLVSNVCLQ